MNLLLTPECVNAPGRFNDSSTEGKETPITTENKFARALLVAALSLGASLAAPVVASGPTVTACGQGDQMYLITPRSACTDPCPSYDPVAGCWCFKLPPIETGS